MTKSNSFTAIIYKDDDMYIAECPEIGTVDQGETIEQAIAGLKEAIRLYLEEFLLPKTSPRFVTSIERRSIYNTSLERTILRYFYLKLQDRRTACSSASL